MLNVISSLASMTTKIAIERDWVIVIAKHDYDTSTVKDDANPGQEDAHKGQFKEKLAIINASVRRFDLMTSIVAPMAAGAIMSFMRISPRFNGTVLSAIFFAVWNILSFFIEYNLLLSVYNDIPELKKIKEARTGPKENKTVSTKIAESIQSTVLGWKAYFSQGLVLMPSIALSLLYLTVLSFDSITIGKLYGNTQKIYGIIFIYYVQTFRNINKFPRNISIHFVSMFRRNISIHKNKSNKKNILSKKCYIL